MQQSDTEAGHFALQMAEGSMSQGHEDTGAGGAKQGNRFSLEDGGWPIDILISFWTSERASGVVKPATW